MSAAMLLMKAAMEVSMSGAIKAWRLAAKLAGAASLEGKPLGCNRRQQKRERIRNERWTPALSVSQGPPMGSRNLDRVPIREWRRKVETVADMLRERWDVVSKCQACGLMMQTNLRLVARVSGPETSLWNRKEPCRRLGCAGHVEFLARVPGRRDYQPLAAPWPDGKPPIDEAR
jgi:hypothetical protein